MYTEDDKNVDIKQDDSNIKYSDFYTSFDDISQEEKKQKRKKKENVKVSKSSVKEEENYDSFYNSSSFDEVESNNGKKNIIKLIVAGSVLIVLIILLVLFLGSKSKNVKGDIILDKNNITLDIGGKEYISYKIADTNSFVTSKFVSSNEDVAIVSDNGEVTAVGMGEATITIYYTIDEVTREKKCTIVVNDNGTIDKNVSLTLNINNGKDNTWTNKDVEIIPEASSIYGIASIKYTINCDDNCDYKDITNNKITVSSSGITKIKVIAKDKKNQEVTKEVIIKIDKEAPSVTLNSDTNIKSNKDVEVCATCTDTLSGCKQNKVCKKYNASKSNQTITVEDAAGNKSTSKTFNVTITRIASPCTLRVSSDGTVTATLRESASYYGFNSSYTGANELSKKITINASKNGQSGAKVVYYYVKNKNGTGGKCFLTVIKKCACANNSTDPNCQVSCTFTSQ